MKNQKQPSGLMKHCLLYSLTLGIGLGAGYFSRSLVSRESPPVLQPMRLEYNIEDDLSEGLETLMISKMLRKGDSKEALQLLSLRIDTCILRIHPNLMTASDSNKKAATNLFRSVAASRLEFPDSAPQTPDSVKRQVETILKSYAKE